VRSIPPSLGTFKEVPKSIPVSRSLGNFLELHRKEGETCSFSDSAQPSTELLREKHSPALSDTLNVSAGSVDEVIFIILEIKSYKLWLILQFF